ncbi:T9SS type A sorting domain-containing protein [Caldithrix abyssi]|nr:T9SS type A sorting domain-containing protein [Caldithrix abyssi]
MQFFVLNLILAVTLAAQSFPVYIYQELGARHNQINVVFLAEGYRESEMGKFRSDMSATTNALFNISPYKEYKSFFNVYGVEVVSNQSGTDHPKSADDCPTSSEVFEADTYFNSTFDAGNIHRLLVIKSSGKAHSVLRNTVPQWDIGFIIVNHSMYGGSGGTWAVFSTNSSAPQVAIHEAGHSFAGLADEYDCCSTGYEAPNATAETNRSDIKWKQWIKDSTPIPTPENNDYSRVIGLFEGAVYNAHDWFRPKLNCMMQSLGAPFCEVCKEQTILTIYDLVDPHSYQYPQRDSLQISHTYEGLFEIDVRSVQPATINVDWFMDTILVAKNTDVFSVRGADISAGSHQLTAVVRDTTLMVRTDPNAKRTANVTWNLNAGPTLSIGENMIVPGQTHLQPNYPNPFNPSTKISYTLPIAMPVKISVIDMNGRLVKVLVDGLEPQGYHTITWKAKSLSSGIYFFKLETQEGVKIQKGILLK